MKKHKRLKILGITIATLLIFFLTINIIPPTKAVETNPFIKTNQVMIAAHRGGAKTNPENTLKAFKSAVNEYKVDIIESDLYLTKDGYLVYNHDEYIDETCNVNGNMTLEEVQQMISDDKTKAHYIKDLTLEELRQYNFGYYFTDKNGNMPYHNLSTDINTLQENDLQIVEVSELFNTFYTSNKNLKFIIEIKDSQEKGYQAVDQLAETLKKFPEYQNQIVIGTFNPEIEEYLQNNYSYLFRGASTKGAASFIITEMLKINLFNLSSFACLQIPMEYDIGITISLDKKMYINKAHKRNIAVQYWTINDENDMKHLIDLGCDAIMTDDLELSSKVINEYYK